MTRVALLGFPVGHSVSPAMHNAAFAALDLPWRYEAVEVAPADLPAWIDRVRGLEWAGANVTVPHKIAAAARVDELAGPARGLGAINTIVRDGGKLVGHNTDVEGFTIDLGARGVDVANRTAVVLGAGGAARAIAHALQSLDALVRVVCRNRQAGRRMLATLSPAVGEVGLFPWSPDGFRAAGEGATLVVNATPLGMSPDRAQTPWPSEIPLPGGAFVYDLVFNPSETRWVAAAKAAGLRACNGLGMLVEQGARAFELWTGKSPPRELMIAAASAALERQDAQVSYSG